MERAPWMLMRFISASRILTFLIDCREDGLDLESGFNCGCRDQVDDGGMFCEWAASPVLRNAAEQAMLDPIPLRRARRVVSNLDGQTGPSASFWNSTFQSFTRAPFDPPQSAAIVSWRQETYLVTRSYDSHSFHRSLRKDRSRPVIPGLANRQETETSFPATGEAKTLLTI
jgi:hypothetical protein